MPADPAPPPVNVLLVGGGGREHALAIALRRSDRLGELWITHPGNPGLAPLGRPATEPADPKQLYRLVQFCDREKIDLVVIGPEDPLAEGFADKLSLDTHGRPARAVFGPTAAGARLEADKAYAKQLMRAASVPTGAARSFTDYEQAEAYLASRDEPQVIKAAGLARGKGVYVPRSAADARAALRALMVERVVGAAADTVLIEERLAGPEVSVFALVDGRNILTLPTCQDHKRLLDGDEGPNTGGMGAFSPASTVPPERMDEIERDILVPIVDALRRDGVEYRGVLYAGLMLTPAGPKVLEFNCRFGDPEAQVLLPRLASDPLELLLHTANGTLHAADVQWTGDAAVCVVLASEGYPEAPRTGVPIEGLDAAAEIPGVTVFHAGTKAAGGKTLTAGGRVLGVTALGPTVAEARDKAYHAAGKITFAGAQKRGDIASSA